MRPLPCLRAFLRALLPSLFLLSSLQARAQEPSAQEPSAAAAQDATEPTNQAPPGYFEAVNAALREHELGNYQEARVHFLRAHQLSANARTLRGLGKVEFELRNYGQAVHYLEEALASQVKPLDEALRKETEHLLERARVYVGEVHVAVEPGSATVSVDGVTVASGPKASISLLVGQHVLEFRAQGRLPERRAIQVRAGEQTLIQVVLPTPPSEPAGLPLHAQPLQRDDDALRKKWWLWTAVGVVATGAAVGIALAAMRDDSPRRATGGTTGAILEAP